MCICMDMFISNVADRRRLHMGPNYNMKFEVPSRFKIQATVNRRADLPRPMLIGGSLGYTCVHWDKETNFRLIANGYNRTIEFDLEL